MRKKWFCALLCSFLLVLTACGTTTDPAESADASGSASAEALPTSISNADWNDHRQFVELDTGITMSYVEMGDAEGEPMLLIHGYSDNSRTWYYVAPHLAEAGYHLYILDLRGHGQSDKPDTGMYAYSDYVADVSSFMDAKGLESAHIVGHSMGSYLAQVFMLSFPERCDSVILEGSRPVANTRDNINYYNRGVEIGEGNYPTAESLGSWYTYYREVDDEFQEFLDYMMEDTLKIPGEAWKAIGATFFTFHMEPYYPYLDSEIPVLILCGELDGALEVQEELTTLIPQAELITYPEVGHNVQFDAPEAMANDVLEFLGAQA